jgi:membrane-bound metal-dependent hydrolase YbcI (DUF457 family)
MTLGMAWATTAFSFLAGVAISAVLAVVPDVIDAFLLRFRVAHRNAATHGLPSLWLPASAILVIGLLLLPAPQYVTLFAFCCIIVGTMIGWGTHLLLDALTTSGIPLPSGHFSWKWAPYNSQTGNRVLCIFGAWLGMASVTVFAGPLYPPIAVLAAIAWAGRWHSARVSGQDECLAVANEDNAEIVATLTAIAVCFERRGEPAKSFAYRRAARSIRALRGPIHAETPKASLTTIYGVGNRIAAVIRNTLREGHCEYLEQLRAYTPGLNQRVPRSLLRTPPNLHQVTTITPEISGYEA